METNGTYVEGRGELASVEVFKRSLMFCLSSFYNIGFLKFEKVIIPTPRCSGDAGQNPKVKVALILFSDKIRIN